MNKHKFLIPQMANVPCCFHSMPLNNHSIGVYNDPGKTVSNDIGGELKVKVLNAQRMITINKKEELINPFVNVNIAQLHTGDPILQLMSNDKVVNKKLLFNS